MQLLSTASDGTSGATNDGAVLESADVSADIEHSVWVELRFEPAHQRKAGGRSTEHRQTGADVRRTTDHAHISVRADEPGLVNGKRLRRMRDVYAHLDAPIAEVRAPVRT
jgi:hypothetical protein